MNCHECKEQLVGYLEGVSDKEMAGRVETHLAYCPTCNAELGQIRELHDHLVQDGKASTCVSLETGVMDQIMNQQSKELRRIKMRKRFKFIGVSSAAAAAAIVLFVVLLGTPDNNTQAAQVLARGAKAAADLKSIHIKCMMRTGPADNFSHINPKLNMVPIELWKLFGDNPKWRIEKPKRVAVMDGESTVVLIDNRRGIKVDKPTESAFDTDWLHKLAAVDKTISGELNSALVKGRDLKLTHETTADGSHKLIVTIEVKSGLDDNDYLKNKFIFTSNTRREYTFDADTERLEGLKVYCHTPQSDVLILQIAQIDYDPQIKPSVFTLKIPKKIAWFEPPRKLPDNEKYEKMKPEEAAQAFFEACSKENWKEVRKFWTSSIDDKFKLIYGGL